MKPVTSALSWREKKLLRGRCLRKLDDPLWRLVVAGAAVCIYANARGYGLSFRARPAVALTVLNLVDRHGVPPDLLLIMREGA